MSVGDSKRSEQPEPWLRGTLTDVPAVARAVLHALELAREDLRRWCNGLSAEELNERPGNIAPVAFQLRHIARSLDRLLTYAEGNELEFGQLEALRCEMESGGSREELLGELEAGLTRSEERVSRLGSGDLEAARFVGKKRLATTLGGLMVHIADHTQRHVGQAITTAKIVMSQRA
jgi:uncharacterized damage-inducible protein DinB